MALSDYINTEERKDGHLKGKSKYLVCNEFKIRTSGGCLKKNLEEK